MRTSACALLCTLIAVTACQEEEDPPLTREQLLDPESCKTCHPTHYREWASSMHAYAIDDPVFQAMNRRGQEETNGELGDFCVGCHAPMAVRENAISDFAEVEDIPQHLKGVTCYFCHNAVGVGDHFNNDITLADDSVMRGGIRNPVRTTAHAAEYSRFHDRQTHESSVLCGSCHDVVTPLDAHIERTFAEYQESLVANLPLERGFQSCQNCHMPGRPSVVATDPNAPVQQRELHSHLFPGVDVALTDFPDRELQRLAVECELANSLRITLIPGAITPGLAQFTVQLETDAGHNQPSGAAQDRRMWVEFVAYDRAGNVLSGSSGMVEDDEPEDPAARTFRDRMFNAKGDEVHMFWEAASHSADTLPPGKRLAPGSLEPGQHTVDLDYEVLDPRLYRVTARVRMRPMGFDVLQDLIDSEHLDPSVRDAMPTFTLKGTELEWTLDSDPRKTITNSKPDIDCPDDYLCMLEPGSVYCD